MTTVDTTKATILMRRITGFDLFRKQEQETMKLDTTTPFKLTVHMPIIASKWKALREEDRMVFIDRAKDCEPVPSKSRKQKRKRNPSSVDENGSETMVSSNPSGKKRKARDPNMPKRPLSAFIFFSCSRRASLVLEHPDMKPTECLQRMGKEWKELVDREQYHAMAALDRIRYTNALAALK